MSRETIAAGVTLVLTAQAAMIIALLASKARRRETEARNNAILRALPDLMFVQTRDGVYVDYSAKDQSVLLAPPSVFVGKHMRDILPPALSARFAESFARLVAGGEEPEIVEYEVPMSSGELRQFEARVVRCERDKFLSIVRDITIEKRAAAELGRAHAELLRVSRLAALGEFAGSLAHELAQPLTAIIANAHACVRLLEHTPHDVAEVREALHDVVESGKVAREVVHHTRHLFRNEVLERTSLDLADVVNEVRVMMSSMLQANRVTLQVKVDADLLPVRGDRVQLRQVILNLTSNAIQAMEHLSPALPRRLTIHAMRDEYGLATLIVSDTGIGLANVDRERMFSASYSTKPNGMGWGLSISRSIVEAHGGRLWAETNADGGASFSFTLPAGGGDVTVHADRRERHDAAESQLAALPS